MNIGSGNKYPSNALSNFAPHPFEIDGVLCNSMEGFLQSLKFKSIEMQQEVCKLVGFTAKKKGRDKSWWRKQVLWWQGNSIDRHSEEYQNLLDKAYNALYENKGFRRALKASKNSVLKHSIGKSNPNETILTVKEFCSRLTYLRDYGPLPNRTSKFFEKDLEI